MDEANTPQKVETLIMTRGGERLLTIDGVFYPAVGDIIELGKPNRDAVVHSVRLRFTQGVPPHIVVDIEDTGELIRRDTADRIITESGE